MIKVIQHFRIFSSRALKFGVALANKRATLHSLGSLTLVFIVLLIDRSLYSYMMEASDYGVSTKYLAEAVIPDWSDVPGKEEYNYHFENSLDEKFVKRVSDELASDAWIRRIISVERVYPDILRIKVERRKPLVEVNINKFYYLVDCDGVVLPGRYTGLLADLKTYEVKGVTKLPPPPAGKRWGGAVGQAVEVAQIMATDDLFGKLGIKVIDVSNVGDKVDSRKSEITLWTENGVGILWGRASSTNKFGEISNEEKIKNLKKVVSLYPNLYGLKYVKLYIRDYPSVMLGSKERIR